MAEACTEPELVERIRQNGLHKLSGCAYVIKDKVLSVSPYVEGVDIDPIAVRLKLPIQESALVRVFKDIQLEADAMWYETHGCEGCGPAGESGYTSINPDCETCGGEGAII